MPRGFNIQGAKKESKRRRAAEGMLQGIKKELVGREKVVEEKELIVSKINWEREI